MVLKLQKVFRTESLTGKDLFFLISLSATMVVLDTIRKKCYPRLFTELSSNQAYKHDKKSSNNPTDGSNIETGYMRV